ncbi:MAG: hypothetical protein M1817_000710 [Caeruleum heppii]|nr:MAG: hypothetical protein M1817_000710 [Caeruleum heppii]
MICHRCLHRTAAPLRPLTSTSSSPSSASVISTSLVSPPTLRRKPFLARPLTSTAPRTAEVRAVSPTATLSKPRQTPSGTHEGPPSAVSAPGVAQPFSTPLTPAAPASLSRRKEKDEARSPVSSVPAGTVLRGLGYMKNKTDPVAMEESEYPGWLWGCLDAGPGKKGGSGDGKGGEEEGDLFSKSKNQRRLAAKRLRKEALLDSSLDPNAAHASRKIPLEEQSIDLPSNASGTVGGALEALQHREKLRKAMRGKRRGGIKEANFLRGMR